MALRIFKTMWFTRFSEKESISDNDLLDIVKEYDAGNCGISLGGNVFKKRIARAGEGKSGGFRFIICFRREERIFFIYGFAKSDKDNVDAGELAALKKLAKVLLNMPEKQLNDEISKNRFIEIHGENQ